MTEPKQPEQDTMVHAYTPPRSPFDVFTDGLQPAEQHPDALARLEAWLAAVPGRDASFRRESFGHAPRPGFDVVLRGRVPPVIVEEWTKERGITATIHAAIDAAEKVGL